MATRKPIPRLPQLNYRLTPKLIKLLTRLCFREKSPFTLVDLTFVFGTSFFLENVSFILSHLITHDLTPAILLTGGISPEGNPQENSKSQARLIYEKIKSISGNIRIYLEENSQNTLENVTKGIELFDFTGKNKVGFVFPSYASQRGYLTLRRFLPQKQIMQFSYDATFPDSICPISAEKWHTFDAGRRRVWGEFLRIKQYGQRGDIAYEEIKDLIEAIDHLSKLSSKF